MDGTGGVEEGRRSAGDPWKVIDAVSRTEEIWVVGEKKKNKRQESVGSIGVDGGYLENYHGSKKGSARRS